MEIMVMILSIAALSYLTGYTVCFDRMRKEETNEEP